MFRRLKRLKRRATPSPAFEQKREINTIKKTAGGQSEMEDFHGERMLYLFPASIKEIGGNKWGYINSKGEFILAPTYDQADEFQENGLAVVRLHGKTGAINNNGYFIVKPEYEAIHPFSEGRAVVIDKQGSKVIDERGKEITATAYPFISDYHEGRALFADTAADGVYFYGFLNRRGKEVLPIAYEKAGNFCNGKAIVKMIGGSYALINLTGKVLSTYPFAYVGDYGDSLLVFQKRAGGLYGFLDEQGNIVIEPKFTEAQPFKEGRAIVNVNGRSALIDRTGHYLIKPNYQKIQDLGEERLAIGKTVNPDKPDLGFIYAVADTAGHIFTGFIYNGINKYEAGRASAFHDEETFFIDKNGNKMAELPVVKGRGKLCFSKKLIKAEIDERLFYFDKNGNPVWKPNMEIILNGQFIVLENKYKPNKDFLIYYPQLNGLADKKTQAKINQTLKDLSGLKETNPFLKLESNYKGDFGIAFFQKKLVVIEITGGNYLMGAPHGLPVRKHIHINLKTGEFLHLKDLFKPGSQYVKVLSEIIGKQIKNNGKYAGILPGSYKGIQADQSFFICDGGINIYFSPHEIASAGEESSTFTIPFAELAEIIDSNGSIWQAFLKKDEDES